jgi:hypothetical protein
VTQILDVEAFCEVVLHFCIMVFVSVSSGSCSSIVHNMLEPQVLPRFSRT